ncbi:30S ribosomal protein S6 [Chloroflexota bacterium]
MQDYELLMIISPELKEEELASSIEKVSQFITTRSGVITELNQWGKRKLAYPIKRFAEGNYVQTQFKMESHLTKELEANLRISEEVLRHLLIRSGD